MGSSGSRLVGKSFSTTGFCGNLQKTQHDVAMVESLSPRQRNWDYFFGQCLNLRRIDSGNSKTLWQTRAGRRNGQLRILRELYKILRREIMANLCWCEIRVLFRCHDSDHRCATWCLRTADHPKMDYFPSITTVSWLNRSVAAHETVLLPAHMP